MFKFFLLNIVFVVFLMILPVQAKINLADKLSGYILLQVEEHGKAWYVNPVDKKRYYLGRPSSAFRLMQWFGVGITDKDLNKVPIGLIFSNDIDSDEDGLSDNFEIAIGTNPNNPDSDSDGYNDKEEVINNYNPIGAGKKAVDKDFVQNNLGKFFLQTERNGEAWYLNPLDHKRYYLGRPSDAFLIMRYFGLGISNKDIETIAINTSQLSNPQSQSSDTDNIIANIASAIRQNDINKIVSFFVPEMQSAVKYTINFLDDGGQLLLANVLSSAKLSQAGNEEKIYTAEVYFNGEKVKVRFILKKRNNKWLLANL